jgi:hypothetical protein
MNNDKKLFTARASERAALMLKSNPKMLRSQALRMAAQELTHYLVASLEGRSGVYRATLAEAEAAAATLRSAGCTDVTVTPPEFAASVLEETT